MFDSHQKINKWLALATFFISLIIYTITMAPTASFWDAGEFIAVAHGLQVNHPPGAPFYSILGRLFSMLMPTEYVAVSINFMSVVSSALTVMLLYLIIIRLIKEFKQDVQKWNLGNKVAYYGGGLVGYLAVSLPIERWGSSLSYIKAGAVPIIALAVWVAIRKVKGNATGVAQPDQ